MEARDKFGFIWALFVLHCFFPEIYPLFDQHVYRAYRNIESSGGECPLTPPLNWFDYIDYRNFFCAQIEAVGLSYWEVDRALWAFGKHKKQMVKTVGKVVTQVRGVPSKNVDGKLPWIPADGLPEEWVHSTTFGGKAKSFWWKIDDDCNIHIVRLFNTTGGIINSSRFVSREEVEQLTSFMEVGQWFPLANNVEKLRKGEEKEGIGRLLYEQLKWNTTDCQLAGHLGVIFSLSGIWEYNGKERGIKFRRLNKDWQMLVRDRYCETVTVENRN